MGQNPSMTHGYPGSDNNTSRTMGRFFEKWFYAPLGFFFLTEGGQKFLGRGRVKPLGNYWTYCKNENFQTSRPPPPK